MSESSKLGPIKTWLDIVWAGNTDISKILSRSPIIGSILNGKNEVDLADLKLQVN